MKDRGKKPEGSHQERSETGTVGSDCELRITSLASPETVPVERSLEWRVANGVGGEWAVSFRIEAVKRKK